MKVNIYCSDTVFPYLSQSKHYVFLIRSGFLETGVERIVDQVVNPKINTVFLPQVEDVVYRFLGIEKPQRTENKNATTPLKINILETLLPTDLEAISPDSDLHEDEFDNPTNESEKPANASSENTQDDLNDSKMDEDESPPFEPLEETVTLMVPEENSVDSHMSGFSGLASHDSNHSREPKVDVSNQDSQMSKHSSEGQMSFSVSDDNETKMEMCEDSRYSKSSKSRDSSSKFEFNQDSQSNSEKSAANEKKQEEKREHKSSSSKHKSNRSEKKEEKDKDKDKRSENRDKKDKHSSSKDAKSSSSSSSKDKKDSKSSSSTKHESRSEKEYDKDKSKTKSSTSRHSSSSRDKNVSSSSSKKESHNKEKNVDKDKSKSSSSSKEHAKDSKPKDKNDTKISSHSSSKQSSDKHKKDEKPKHSSSSHHKDKRDGKKDTKKDTKDDHFSSKHKKHDRRSKDRDSSDGQSNQKNTPNFTVTTTSSSESQKPNQESSGSNSGSADSGNSETDAAEKASQAEDFHRIKIIKPKFASNIHEAKRLMKIRKQLDKIEKRNKFSLDLATDNSLVLIRESKSGGNGILEAMNLESANECEKLREKPLNISVVTQDKSEEDAKLIEKKEEDTKNEKDLESIENILKTSNSSIEEQPNENVIKIKSADVCISFETPITAEAQRFLDYAKNEMQRLEKCLETPSSIEKPHTTKNNLKRKRNSDIKNNNKKCDSDNTDVTEMQDAECGLVKRKRRSSAMVTVLNDNFSLPLSPAESDKSIERKVDVEKVKRQSWTSKGQYHY